MTRFAIHGVVLAALFAVVLQSAASVAEESAGAPVRAAAGDVLAAEAEGLVGVRYIPNDARSAQIVVSNRSDRPLTLRLPSAFVGVPVLAQLNMGGGNNQAGFGAGGIGAQPQTTGGGMQNAGMGIGGAPGGNAFCWVAREVYGVHDPRWLEFRDWMTTDAPQWLRDTYVVHGEDVAAWMHDKPVVKRVVRGAMDHVIAARGPRPEGGHFRVAGRGPEDGAFVVAPGKSRTFRFTTVCLEYGKPEPNPRIPYRLQALESFSADPRLEFVLACLANGQVSQKAAQAAAWHVANGRTWPELAAEMIDHAGGDPDEPFFGAADLAVARKIVELADRLPAADSAAVTSPRE